MLMLDTQTSTLVVVDVQSKLVPVIDEGATVVENVRRLVIAAGLLGVPTLFTEQNAKRLGSTVPELAATPTAVAHKMTFDAVRAAGFLERLTDDRVAVVAGCEAHVCVLQTVLSLIEHGRRVFVVCDAVGSRRVESKQTALRRMEHHGAEIVTTEMVLFEWLETAEHPRFRETVALIK
jgi:nicotinamidase-related amidase